MPNQRNGGADTVAVIGAGSSGLAALKNLRAAGFRVRGFERATAVGGNWNAAAEHSRVYGSTHTISSKPFTQYPDFPMPEAFPDYPHHSQLARYLGDYARHFRLLPHIQLTTEVIRAEPLDGAAGWELTTQDGEGHVETARYGALVIANGHNWSPKWPRYPGEFTGQLLHSADYKNADVLRGRRVLVVGAGNTGCDVAVEAAQHAAAAFHSTRRGYWYAPKYTFGRPSDQVADFWLGLRVPLKLRQWMFKAVLRTTVGDLTRHGLPAPDHEPFETHPIVNSLLLYYVGHGDITSKPDVARWDGDAVVFTDGTREHIDVAVCCTGYLARFDFLDETHLNRVDDHPRLFLNIFTPRHDTLFVAGLIQPDSGQFTLAHWQTEAIVAFLRARRDRPAVAAAFLRDASRRLDEQWSGGAHYQDSSRHYYEIAHQHYLRGVETAINTLDAPA